MKHRIQAKPASKSELARAYRVSVRTLNNWLKGVESEVGQPLGRYYTIKQVEELFNHWGEPVEPL